MNYGIGKFKNGLKIIVDGNPCAIIHHAFTKPGKGQAFSRVKLRDLISGKVVEKTFRSGETVAAADVSERTMQYLYNDGGAWYFMDADSFEQYEVAAHLVAEIQAFLVEQDNCSVTLWNGRVIDVLPPNHVTLTVVEADPGVKGDTTKNADKPAKTNTGAELLVPLFVRPGDKIKVDTRTGEYVARV